MLRFRRSCASRRADGGGCARWRWRTVRGRCWWGRRLSSSPCLPRTAGRRWRCVCLARLHDPTQRHYSTHMLQACHWAIDELKATVPIWKKGGCCVCDAGCCAAAARPADHHAWQQLQSSSKVARCGRRTKSGDRLSGSRDSSSSGSMSRQSLASSLPLRCRTDCIQLPHGFAQTLP